MIFSSSKCSVDSVKIYLKVWRVVYNNGKTDIDRSDQMVSYVTTMRKSIKWYRKLAFTLRNNYSKCSYCVPNSHKQKNTDKKISANFRFRVVWCVLRKYCARQPWEENEEGVPPFGDSQESAGQAYKKDVHPTLREKEAQCRMPRSEKKRKKK